MIIIGDHKILMRGICIKCGDLRIFFLPLFVKPFGYMSSDNSLWLFSSHGFHIIITYEFHLFSFLLIFQFAFFIYFILVFKSFIIFLLYNILQISSFLHMINNVWEIWREKGKGFQLSHLRCVLKILSAQKHVLGHFLECS